jgi:hypothetical protein
MSVNVNYSSSRFLPSSQVNTAGGGFTTPQHTFIPHPTTVAIGTGRVYSAEQRAGLLPHVTKPSVGLRATGAPVATSLPARNVYGIGGTPLRGTF